MSAVGRLKTGLRSGAGSLWATSRKLAVKIAIAAAIVVIALALAERGEGSASGANRDGTSASHVGSVPAQAAILSDERAGEQLVLCRYEVKATFGVSIFTDRKMSSKRLIRIHNGDEIHGSCFTHQGGKTLGCAGLSWEDGWIRVQSGTTVGWSPASCFERIGFL